MTPPAARATGVVLRVVLRHPSLLLAAVSETLRLAAPGWWRRWPPLPLPDPALWQFRMETAYGGRGDAVPSAADVVSFLTWSRDMHQYRRR
jgi:hypothetical protein